MKTILLIEDNPNMLDNTAEILELAGYKVATAENGKVGVSKAKEIAPDLIICDIMMPELDGYGVLRILGRDPATARIPFIFLTAKAEKSDFRKCMNLGADDYLVKPFEEIDLLDAIEQRLKRNAWLRKEFAKDLQGLDEFFEGAHAVNALDELPEKGRVRQYAKKSNLFYEGDTPGHCFFVNSGQVKTWKMNDHGKELITGIYGKGDFFGYEAILEGADRHESAAAIENCELVLIPADALWSLINRNRDVANAFIRMLSNNLAEHEERLLNLAYGSVRKRVADVLLELYEKQGKEQHNAVGLRLSREDLAGMVGTATESLIRTLSEFKESELLRIKGREIRVVAPEGLRKVVRYF
ncbi:MAG: response regulator [Salibacteraceae bacterium]